MSEAATHTHTITDTFNLQSVGGFIVKGVVLGAIGYAIWHTGIAAPFIEAALPWMKDGLELLQVDHAFEFLASLVPDYQVETPDVITVDDVDKSFDALDGL